MLGKIAIKNSRHSRNCYINTFDTKRSGTLCGLSYPKSLLSIKISTLDLYSTLPNKRHNRYSISIYFQVNYNKMKMHLTLVHFSVFSFSKRSFSSHNWLSNFEKLLTLFEKNNN